MAYFFYQKIHKYPNMKLLLLYIKIYLTRFQYFNKMVFFLKCDLYLLKLKMKKILNALHSKIKDLILIKPKPLLKPIYLVLRK
jgi:hypothetical protein